MEFLLFCLVFFTCYLVGFKPEKVKLANICLCGCIGFGVFIWVMATWSMLVPAGNL